MKYLPLVWAGLWRKPLRTIFTTLALVIAFVLFGLLQGINTGFNVLIATSRMDRVYVDPRFGSPMPLAYEQQIAQMPGAKSVSGQAYMPGTIGGDPKRPFFVGLADDGIFDYYSEFNTTPAQIAEFHSNRTALIISKAVADRSHLNVGDHIVVRSGVAKKNGSRDWEFDITAIIDRDDLPGLAGFAVGNFDYLNEERASGKDMMNEYLIVMSDPNLSVATTKAIDGRYLSSGAPTKSQVEKLSREQSQTDDNTSTMVNSIILSTLFALLLMTSNSMMQSFRERVPELGTLKALGFDDRQVLGLVLAEATVQCLAGAALSLAIARLTVPYAKKIISGPAGFMIVPWSVVGLGLGIAILVALVSAAVPAWRAGRMEIVNALAAR